MAHSFYSCREPFYFEQSGWGLVEMHLWSNLHQRRNNIQHGPWSWCLHQLEHQFGWLRSQANEDLLFQIRQSRSIHPLLTIIVYQIFAHLVRWIWLLSIIATDFLVENHAKCLISSLSGESEKVPCRTALTFLRKLRLRFASLLTHAFVDLLHPIWYLTPVSDIPGRTYAHLRSAAVGMLKYPGLGHN